MTNEQEKKQAEVLRKQLANTYSKDCYACEAHVIECKQINNTCAFGTCNLSCQESA